tara:strand:+ start:451 stop:705 length:255 start_codon:yes stop_codon:yes gene_type:complete
MTRNKDSLENIIQRLQDDQENDNSQKWNESISSKLILLFPTIIFLLTFLRINNDKSIADLFNFLLVSLILVSFGVILNFLITKK